MIIRRTKMVPRVAVPDLCICHERQTGGFGYWKVWAFNDDKGDDDCDDGDANDDDDHSDVNDDDSDAKDDDCDEDMLVYLSQMSGGGLWKV